jgi:hypothetical protein
LDLTQYISLPLKYHLPNHSSFRKLTAGLHRSDFPLSLPGGRLKDFSEAEHRQSLHAKFAAAIRPARLCGDTFIPDYRKHMHFLKMTWLSLTIVLFFPLGGAIVIAQTLGHGGTVEGIVLDPSGAAIVGAEVQLHNVISQYIESATTDSNGSFQFRNVPPNPYHIVVRAPGFQLYNQDISLHGSLPFDLKISLEIAGASNVITVESSPENILEGAPYAHEDLTKEIYAKLPTSSPGSALSDAIVLSSPAVVADSNGFFHPLGDHAQVSYSIDGQPINDQQSKAFSTQLPLNAIRSMELITGSPDAEYGDKTSLVVNATTQSGLGRSKPFGSFAAQYGSFGTVSEEAGMGWGTSTFGNYLVVNTSRSGRFLDTPEFQPIHAIGNNETLFDHIDYEPRSKDIFHMNLSFARNWFQIPNSYDQLSQDQRQKVISYNIAPSYQHIFDTHMLLSINAFFRQDQVRYYPSNNLFNDSPATIAQARRLMNFGLKTDISYVRGIHSLKAGLQIMRTRLKESFNLGITDPMFNAVCVDADGNPLALPGVTDPAQCSDLGFAVNPSLQPALIPYDLTRGGMLFAFAGGPLNIDQFAAYVQDAIKFKNITISPGLRIDRYSGLASNTGVQPRLAASYIVNKTRTVFRIGYSRTFETPYNENLILSSATGAGGLGANIFVAYGSRPLEPGNRNQFNAGLEQSLGRLLRFDGDYFWKYTQNAFDFASLLSTPIAFPISWRKSKIDGVSMKLSTTNIHGFQAYLTIGHTRARFFGPETGGLIFNSPLSTGVFRIDHDQAFQQTTNLRYQRSNSGAWISFTWRYDSGAVAGAVASLEDALSLTAAQQAAIGFFCGSEVASLGHPITACTGSDFGATRLRIPAPGTANDDLNPPRIAPRNLFSLGIGTDNLLRMDKSHIGLRFTVENLTNKIALYNFLSTFSGTHFVSPRAFQGEIRFWF